MEKTLIKELPYTSLGKCNLKDSGKDLSFNNIYDLEIAIELAEQFRMHSCVILKHGNPCGVSLGTTQTKAYKKLLNVILSVLLVE